VIVEHLYKTSSLPAAVRELAAGAAAKPALPNAAGPAPVVEPMHAPVVEPAHAPRAEGASPH
jgi:hypothetical protein